MIGDLSGPAKAIQVKARKDRTVAYHLPVPGAHNYYFKPNGINELKGQPRFHQRSRIQALQGQ